MSAQLLLPVLTLPIEVTAMEKRVLAGIQPERVFYYFEEICKIPHGSRNTKPISDWLVGFAKEHGLRAVQDETNNVIIFKQGSAGYEDHPAVILQGHIDMVAEKTAESPIDFMKDGLDIATDGEYIFANGTTLGGDDGIAVAYALALLESDRYAHPPLECVFTVDEEIGMEGAAALDTSVLTGKMMINADSEDEGIFTVSCAGGATSRIALPIAQEKADGVGIHIFIDGLIGGHSGQEINKGRSNANKLMAKLLEMLLKQLPFRLVYIRGGQKDNAIPRSCMSKIIVAANRADDAVESISKIAAELKTTLSDEEQYAKITCEKCVCRGHAMNIRSTRNVIALLNELPNGVQAMSEKIPGLVQTSLNLGILKTEPEAVVMTFSVRSSVNAEKQALIGVLKELASKYGAEYSQSGEYPAWEYKEDSYLRNVMVRTFEENYGREPVVEAIHAGLECGLFSDKIPGLDCVSIGPDMQDIHTTRERLNIASVSRTWEFLTEVLEKL